MDDSFFTGLKVVKLLLPVIIILLPFLIIVAIIGIPVYMWYLFIYAPKHQPDPEPTAYEVYEDAKEVYDSSSVISQNTSLIEEKNSEIICFGSDETGYAVIPAYFNKNKDGSYETENDDFNIIVSVMGFPKEGKSFEECVNVVKEDLRPLVSEPLFDDYSAEIAENLFFELPNYSKDGQSVNHMVIQCDMGSGKLCFCDITETEECIQIFKMFYLRKNESDAYINSYPDYLLELQNGYPKFGFYHYYPEGVVN